MSTVAGPTGPSDPSNRLPWVALAAGVLVIAVAVIVFFLNRPSGVRSIAEGCTRANPPPWRVYRAGAKVRGLDIHVQLKAGQQARLVERFKNIQDAQKHLFRGTMQRYIFEDEADPTRVIISLIWKDTELSDERTLQEELATFQHELADLLDWSTAQFTKKRAIIHT